MIVICDQKAKETRIQNKRNSVSTNVKYNSYYVLIKDNKPLIKSINEIVQIEDAREEERQYTKYKFKTTYEFIDIEAYNAFSASQSLVKMKCCYGFNIVGVRNN